MRKLLIVITLIILMLSLPGCTVNWFDKHYDVEWFVIAIPVTVIFLILHIYIMSATYICPKCGANFKPKWYQITAYLHFMGKRLVRCPICQKMNYLKN
ncbi:MAG: hypothetical protein Q4B14_01915, partial [Clostridia bacterium]|nr:hypothetical protein [Clostridia bacterium]